PNPQIPKIRHKPLLCNDLRKYMPPQGWKNEPKRTQNEPNRKIAPNSLHHNTLRHFSPLIPQKNEPKRTQSKANPKIAPNPLPCNALRTSMPPQGYKNEPKRTQFQFTQIFTPAYSQLYPDYQNARFFNCSTPWFMANALDFSQTKCSDIP
ncbi:MAG: hypothetical protein JSU94_10040, partial [Phycisphaerales bacterium]